MKLEELKPYKQNPRRNDNAVQYVANSIEAFGFRVPLVIDKDNVIVAGHTRYKAAKQLGLQEVPCTIADDLTEEQIKAYRLADNKVAEIANWDFELLPIELEGLDFDMASFGFYSADSLVLDVDDEDFLQDTEATKEKKGKEVVCPHCGEAFIV